jgi:hypothetical protein
MNERPVPKCGHWIGSESRYCHADQNIRQYIPGHRCPQHTPAALQGKPEVPPGPGWPVHQEAASA